MLSFTANKSPQIPQTPQISQSPQITLSLQTPQSPQIPQTPQINLSQTPQIPQESPFTLSSQNCWVVYDMFILHVAKTTLIYSSLECQKHQMFPALMYIFLNQ